MGGFSIWHWLIVLFFVALVGVPLVKILRRAGFSGWWALLVFVPFGALVGLWLLAFVPWRTDAQAPKEA